MKYLIALVLFSSFAMTAFAQTPPEDDIAADWQTMMNAQKHLADDLRQIVQQNKALKTELEKAKTPAPANTKDK